MSSCSSKEPASAPRRSPAHRRDSGAAVVRATHLEQPLTAKRIVFAPPLGAPEGSDATTDSGLGANWQVFLDDEAIPAVDSLVVVRAAVGWVPLSETLTVRFPEGDPLGESSAGEGLPVGEPSAEAERSARSVLVRGEGRLEIDGLPVESSGVSSWLIELG